MEELTFKNIKDLEYPDGMPFKYILIDLLMKKLLDVNYILTCYSTAIEKENHVNKMKFEEACVNLAQILSGNFKGEDEEQMLKRAIHTYNLNKTFVPNIYNEQYNYTEKDKEEWDNFFKSIYGIDLKNE